MTGNQFGHIRFIVDTLHIEIAQKEGSIVSLTSYNGNWAVIDIHSITLADCLLLKAALDCRTEELKEQYS